MPSLYRLPRLRNLVVPLMFLLCLTMLFAHPAHAADIEPVGIGDLMPSPDFKVPAGEGTLYETYQNPLKWLLDSDFGIGDVLDPTLESVADICMALITVIGSAAVVIVQWIFQLTSIPALENAVTRSISGASKGLTETFLPSALAVGGLVAFVHHKRGGGGGGLSQIAWVFISGVVSISLLTSPGTWVGGVDSARTLGANITMSATAAGLGDGTTDFPFKLGHDPKFTGNGRDDMLRKSSDAVWRSYVATPWCLAEFGSFEVCKKYGAQLLDRGIDPEKRKEWLQDHVTSDAVGKDSVGWRQGHDPIGRIAVCIPSLIAVVIFAALVIVLAFTSLASLLGALMLLLTGVVFSCLWVIPGRPRQWGIAWFDQLLARTLQSLIATLVLGAVLSLQTATTLMFGTYGWLPSAGLSIAVAIVGVQFRSTVAQIFGVSTSNGGALAGFLAARALSKLAGGKTKWRPKSGGSSPRPGDKGGSGSGSGGGGTAGSTGRGGGRGPGDSPTRVPTQRPPAPAPIPAEAAPPRPDHVVTLERDTGSARRAPVTIPQRRRSSLPATANGGSRPAVTGADSTAGGGPALPPGRTAPQPTPTLRPEHGDVPDYGFRQAPPPRSPGEPRVIRGTVVARGATVTRPSRRPASSTPPPARRAAPTGARGSAPSARVSGKG